MAGIKCYTYLCKITFACGNSFNVKYVYLTIEDDILECVIKLKCISSL